MKTRGFIIAALALQICFLLFFVFQAPELDGAIKVGLKQLKEEAPTQAQSAQIRTDGIMKLKTAGDFFYVAEKEARFILGATVWVGLSSIVMMTLALIFNRNKIKTVGVPET
jgi:hypothetical protein